MSLKRTKNRRNSSPEPEVQLRRWEEEQGNVTWRSDEEFALQYAVEVFLPPWLTGHFSLSISFWSDDDYCNPDKLLLCPYDANHKIRACRFPYHLIKCRKVGMNLFSYLKMMMMMINLSLMCVLWHGRNFFHLVYVCIQSLSWNHWPWSHGPICCRTYTFTHSFTPMADLVSPVPLLESFWEVGRNRRTWRKPTWTQEVLLDHRNFSSLLEPLEEVPPFSLSALQELKTIRVLRMPIFGFYVRLGTLRAQEEP